MIWIILAYAILSVPCGLLNWALFRLCLEGESEALPNTIMLGELVIVTLLAFLLPIMLICGLVKAIANASTIWEYTVWMSAEEKARRELAAKHQFHRYLSFIIKRIK